MTFSVRLDFARHTDMLHRRHINEEPAWQRDVGSYPRTFLGDRFLRYLDQDFLSFFQQVGNGWLMAFTPRDVATARTLGPAISLVAVLALLRPLNRRRRCFYR